MTIEQHRTYEEIISLQKQLTELQTNYWEQFTNINTWQFWIILLMTLLPLVILYFAIDRTGILLYGFYGFNIHVWFSYINIFGVKEGFWAYPYELLPFIPGNLALDAALIPVLFMLVYQWTSNHNKNFYVYTILLSLVLSFIFKPILVAVGLFDLREGLHYVHLLFAYIIIFLLSKLITNLFLKMQRR